MKRYKFLEHTADMAAEIYGESLKGLFHSAALAMFSILVSKQKNTKALELKDVVIEKEEESLEDLIKSWLDELLFLYVTKDLILHRVKSFDVRPNSLKATLLCEVVKGDKFQVKNEIKAVTYYELSVQKVGNRWKAHIVFDV